MLDHFCVLSVLLTVIFGAILHFFIQGMAILHSWDGYFTFWERNYPGHYTQELGTDCISTAISLIISSLHQWEASVFFYFVHYMNKKYLKSISRWFPRAGYHWRLPHQQQASFQRHLVWAERVTHEKCEGSRIIQVSVIKRCNRSKHKSSYWLDPSHSCKMGHCLGGSELILDFRTHWCTWLGTHWLTQAIVAKWAIV